MLRRKDGGVILDLLGLTVYTEREVNAGLFIYSPFPRRLPRPSYWVLWCFAQVDGQRNRTRSSPGHLRGLKDFKLLFVGGYSEYTPELLPLGSRFRQGFQGERPFIQAPLTSGARALSLWVAPKSVIRGEGAQWDESRVISRGHGGGWLLPHPLITPCAVSGCVQIYFDANKSLQQGHHTNNRCHHWHHLCSLITGLCRNAFRGASIVPADVPSCGAQLP